MKQQITYQTKDNNDIEIIYENEMAIITIYLSLDELNTKYAKSLSQINLDFIRMLIKENTARIIKKFKIDASVEEWANTEKTLLFKKEEGLVLAVDITNPNNYIYLEESDIKMCRDIFSFSLKLFNVVKANQTKEKQDKKAIAKNLDITLDLGMPPL